MQTLQVMTEIEKPGTVLVEAFNPDGAFIRDGQAAGFFVRRRKAGAQFKLARWDEFSPRWMKFVGDPPADWLEKIEQREKNTSRNAEIASIEQGKTAADRQRDIAEAAASAAVSFAQAGKPVDAGSFDFANGKVRPTLGLKK